MKVWLVNPFDPLPGDPEQAGRYATLAKLLVSRGHEVTWWTSDFSHRFKRPIDQSAVMTTCKQNGIRVKFLHGISYQANVSVRRLLNHAQLAANFQSQAKAEAAISKPGTIVASVPPPSLAAAAVNLAHEVGAKSIIDVQDLWPETFERLAPTWARPVARMAFSPIARQARMAYSHADVIVGVADQYVNHAVTIGRSHAQTATIPIGIDLEEFDRAVQAGKTDEFTKPPGEKWLIYSGSLSRSYDWQTVIYAFANIQKVHPETRLFLTGRGELSAKAEALIAALCPERARLIGFMDFPRWAYLLSQCDIGFNASFPEAMIYLPNKLFYYLAAGLAVLNTIPGQCSRILAKKGVGIDYAAASTEQCAAAVTSLIGDTSLLLQTRTRARDVASVELNRASLYQGFVALIAAR